MADGIRLNKALADAGLCSRRGADDLIFAGQVAVNGQVETNPATRVDPSRDKLTLKGKSVDLAGAKAAAPCWLMLHKPVGMVCTVKDPEGRPTVMDLIPAAWRSRRLYPVGRLDFFSEGLLLMTDEGELAHRLMHPRWHLPRVYEARVRPDHGGNAVPPAALEAMRKGMTLREGEKLAPVDVTVLQDKGPGVLLHMTLHQGLNRQIRRMCRDLGLTVLRLKRAAQGPLQLGDLPSGAARSLRPEEVAALRKAVGL